MNWLQCGIVLVVAVLSTIALTPVAKAIALQFDAVDYPDKRRINKRPVPRMGGVAMFGAIIICCAVIKIGVALWAWPDPFQSSIGFKINYVLLGLGVFFMFAVGVVDDIISLNAKLKLLLQIVACCIVASSGLLLTKIQNPFMSHSLIEFGILAYPITVFYLVAFANIINLIDGLDGLASGISAISAATIFTFAVLSGRIDSAILCVIIIGVCIGFLKYNHYPAKIFMGDSGSLLLGLSLGIVSLLAVARSTLFISLLVPIMAAGVPVIDTLMAIIRRKRAHQPVDSPDRGHIHHRLLNQGFSQPAAAGIMWAWTAALAICSIVLAESEGILRAIAIIIAAVITAYGIIKLHLVEPVLLHHYNPRNKNGKPHKNKDTNQSNNHN
jgi:UDP-GlcNAc:undecaprenyl-phosphate GlcNAc-1-phosphate transferase